MTMPKPENQDLVVTVIVNWNRPRDTIECVESLAAVAYENHRIIVVDNGSDDGSVEQMRAAIPRTELLVKQHNLGFAGGVNVGIDRALDLGASYVWLLNNDTVVAPDCLHHLVTAIQDEATVGIAVPKIYYHDRPTHIWSAGARWEACPPRVTMIGLRQRDSSEYDRRHDLDYATGCAMLIPAHIFEAVGAFDPTYFMYQEDYDFCCRVRQSGFRILYVPQSRVWHKVSRSLGENSPEKWYHWSRSAVIFYRRHFSAPTLAFFLAWVVARETLKGSISFLRPLVHGVRDGMRTTVA
jgi:hypothetical protein